ncbi:MAG: AMP-binding protein [Immundisolibacter sp.]|uniref:class I adenylate-forming enzyme family protein n=1 Tax=Immundisolibacter sp. TaxID=1934948 RepID=UPI0019A6B670|nr:AMP-binding protein [Immundisolibacter sp.]MBC7161149.1 AMP-binding protein [Immundisolibacter sp.]
MILPRDLLRRCGAALADHLAFIDGDRRRTWGDMDRRADRLAAALQGLGIGKGDVCAVLAHDRVEVVEHWYACLKLGALRVGINWRYAAREMLHLLHDSSARALLVEASCVPLLAGELDALRRAGLILIGFGAGHGLPLDYDTLLAKADRRPTLPALAEDDLIAISYTTGTTGLPKGALWTQRGVRDALVYSSLMLGLRQSDLYYAPFPMAGVPLLCATLGLVNGMAVLLPDGDFDAARSLELMAEHRATTGIFVPTMLQRLLERHAAGHHDLSALRMVSYGSSPATPQLIRGAMSQLGCEMIQLYGLTEATAGWLSFLQHEDHLQALGGRPELLGSCGRPALHVDLSIRGPDGQALPAGEIGEIWVQGSVTTPGYLNRPDENAELLSGSWLRTHDLGRIDEEGYLYLTDRKKFLIITGGYNVYPVTVEAVLAEHPAVREVAVVGAPHRDWGEAVVAIVSLRPGQRATVDELLAFCRPRLGRFEQPKHVVFMDELPKGATGKIAKANLRDGLRADPASLPWPAA